jgi:uncharacterized protein (DUF2147 family)
MKKFVSVLFLCTMALIASAQADKMVGYWASVDDETGKEESIFYIFKATDGKYYGKIMKMLVHQGAVCDKCTGTDHNKPLEGMMLMRDLKADGKNLVGGKILDPKSGKTYNLKISLDEKTGNLKLRGSLDKAGLLGRTQYWVRRKSL